MKNEGKAEADSVITGGSGNDVLYVSADRANDGSIKAGRIEGGLGRDLIVDLVKGSEVYGDTIDGLNPATGEKVADSAENADVFWYAPDVTIMDAQVHDQLVFYGIRLTGGSRNPAYLSTAAAFGGMMSAGNYFDKLLRENAVANDNGITTIFLAI